MDKSCILVGSIYPKHILDSILNEHSHVDFAANTFQLSLLEGFSKYYSSIYVITSPVTSLFPRSKKIVYTHFYGTLDTSNLKVHMIFPGFINLPFLKLISEFFLVKKNLHKSLKEDCTVYIYALHSPFLLAVYSLRKRISNVCVIIPDLPDYMSHNNGLLRRLLKRVNKYLLNKCIKEFPNHVLFSKFMASQLPLQGKKSIVVEGIHSDTKLLVDDKEIKKTILYSGIISSNYGVFDLIEAFHRIDGDDYQLWLCGSCQNKMDVLNKYIRDDHRIKYFGLLQKEQVRKLQRKATLLVNPRHSNEEFTKYSFPSKTMEYLYSGTPTLMCRLCAIPKEYDEFLYYFDDESVDGYKNRIIEVCNLDKNYLQKQGEKARDFIANKKNCYVQAERIFKMVELDG